MFMYYRENDKKAVKGCAKLTDHTASAIGPNSDEANRNIWELLSGSISLSIVVHTFS